MKQIKYLLCMVFIFLPSVIYSQYLEPVDIDIFINGYMHIQNLLNEHKEDEENEGWVAYNGLANDFSAISEEYIKNPTKNKFNDLESHYKEILNCNAPQELENIFKTIGWKTDGNKKFLIITLGWGFLYAAEGMKSEITNIPKLAFKLFRDIKYTKNIQ